jgi:hypothetical protein
MDGEKFRDPSVTPPTECGVASPSFPPPPIITAAIIRMAASLARRLP